jgi:hypothetical protein
MSKLKLSQKKILIFCTTHIYVDYLKHFQSFIKPVGSGTNFFPFHWYNSSNKVNIAHKHISYSDLAGQFWVWQNIIKQNLDEVKFFGFCQYRRLWIKNLGSFINKLANYALRNADQNKIDYFDRKIINFFCINENFNTWKNYDSILTTEIDLSYPKYLKNINFFSIKDQFIHCHLGGLPDTFDQMLDKMGSDIKYDFYEYISKTSLLSPHGMFISKPKIINEYFRIAFKWYESCENIYRPDKKLNLVKSPRFFGWLNERFCDYWFKKNTNFTTQSVSMNIHSARKLSLIFKLINELK